MRTSINAAASMVAVFLFLICQNTFAQVIVRESAPAGQPASVQTPAIVSPAELPQRSFDPSYQLQLLQDEIMTLRGLIEEQAFEIKRLKQQRLDDYLDIDKRITTLESRKVEAVAPVTPSVIPQILPTTNDNANEKQLYNDAISQLLDKQDYDAAKLSFEQYSNTYPSGIYAANVQYWLGQIFLTEGNSQSAETAFKRIVDAYPNHQKASDAQFKLARIYFDKGNKDEAKALLEELVAGKTDAARFAKSFLEENF